LVSGSSASINVENAKASEASDVPLILAQVREYGTDRVDEATRSSIARFVQSVVGSSKAKRDADGDEEEEFEELLRSVDLQAYTPRSIVDPQELRRQLELVRANGYAYNDEELDEGIRDVAAPIFGRFSVRYSVAIVGPTFRLTDEKLPEFIEMVKDTATQISRSLKEHET